MRGTAAALAGGGLLGLAWVAAPVPLLAALTLVAVGTGALLVRRRALWVLALLLFVALPLPYLPVPATLVTVSPPVFVLLALAARTWLDRPEPTVRGLPPGVLLVVVFAGWLAVTVAASAYRAVAVGWLVSYGCLVVLPVLLARADPRARDVLRTTWLALAAGLGAYALLEAFVLRANPLFDPFYAAGGPGGQLLQEWSVYRATTSLGHPVSNGMFFAVAVPLALGRALQRRSWPAAGVAALAAGGVAASGSRSGFAAMLVGAAVVVLLPVPGRGARTRVVAGRVAAVAGLAGVLVLGSASLAARDASGEGASSAAFRATQVPIALQSVAESPVLGTGPGAASLSQESLLARVGGAGAFESYWLELAVGTGLPGLVLGAGVVLAAAVAAARSGAPDVAGAVLAWAVSASVVNALEGGRPQHLVLGLVLAMAFSRPVPTATTVGPATREREALPR